MCLLVIKTKIKINQAVEVVRRNELHTFAVDWEGIKNFDQYKDLVDQAVEEKRSYGFFSEDEDLTQLKESLLARWLESLRLKTLPSYFICAKIREIR